MRFLFLSGALLSAFLLSTQAVAATQYEAESATRSGSAAINTNHTGYTGSGFVDGFFNSTTAQVSFTVSASTAGSSTVTLRYSAGNGTSTNTGLYVNGTKIKNITCNGTSNWDTWATEIETVTLNAGNNTIAYKAESSSGSCINLDYISVQALTQTYVLTISNDGHGTTSPSGTATVNAGTPTPPIVATPATGYSFASWTVTSGTATIANPTSASTTVTLTSGNATIRANFTANTLTLTITNDGHGTTSPSGTATVNAGTPTPPIVATPATGYSFASWTVTSGTATIANPTSASTTVTLTSGNATIRANFTANTLTLTITNDGHGTTSPSGTATVNAGTPTPPIVATPATGYSFASWTVTSGTATIANPTSASTTVTLTSGDATIRANFSATTPTGVSAVTYAEISSPVTVTTANTIVLALPFTAPSAGYITVTATGLYGTNNSYTHEQRGLESFITLNSTSGGSLSGFVEKSNVQNSAQYVSETAGFQVAAGSNTVRLIVSPRTTLTATTYNFVKCKMTVVFSQQKM